MKTPLVTVFMPLYNAEAFLAEAIESILNQEFSDFELLIIDDGSTDGSASIASGYSDPRIRIEHNGENKGLVYTANRGIESARGRFIARMDADDISMPRRLSHQVRFMEANPQIGICGGSIRYFGARSGKMRCICDPDAIKAKLFWSTTFAQPTVMMRKAMLDQFQLRYDPRFRYGAEDYALWNEASRHFPLANLPETLLNYRINPQSVSHKYADALLNNVVEIIKGNFLRLDHPLENDLVDIIKHHIIQGRGMQTMDQLARFEAMLLNLKRLNESKNTYPLTAFNQTLCEQLFRICVKSPHLGMPMLDLCRRSPVGGFTHLRWEQRVRLLSKVIGKTLYRREENPPGHQ